MARRRFLSSSTRESLFGIPSDTAALEQFYVLAEEDLLPEAVVHWLSEQVNVSPLALRIYATREPTRANHRALAIRHLGLRPFASADFQDASDLAAQAALDTDDARLIMSKLLEEMRRVRLVLPTIGSLERIGLTGRARARRLAAQSLNEALSEDQKLELNRLIENDTTIGQSRLAWLRGMPHSTSSASLHALLARLKFVRGLGLPANLGEDIHPVRLTKFAREGAVAPAHLLSDFGERRRIATLAAQITELNIVLTDASIALFEKLTGQLFTRSKNKQSQNWQASQAQVGRLMRLFGSTLHTLSEARQSGEDPFELLDQAVGWERLMSVRPEVDQFSNMATEDPLLLASRRYVQLRKFAPAFMEVFDFELPEAGADLHAAPQLLKEQNQIRKRKLPDIVPMPFPAKHWKTLIVENGKPVRRVYETAVVATLRDRLRAGDAWVEGSRDYRRFDTYLVPKTEALDAIEDTDLPTDGQTWLTEHRELLNHRLFEVQRKLTRGQLEGVRLEKGRLKITPHEAVTPPAGEQLDRAIDAVMPRIRITELLWDVARHTGFLESFTDLRSGRTHANPAAVLASILAGATNLGLERMAQASKNVTHAQLSWASTWHLHPENYSDALAKIIDAHHALPFAQIWGKAEHTSSDGQFFPSRRNAGEINAKYGPDPGLKIYSFLSGQYGSFHSDVIGATVGEAPFVLDGLMGNVAQFNPLLHYVDTGGVSDHVFALFHLLGLSLAPRLRDFPDRRLACFGKASVWKGLSPIMGRPINEQAVLGHWDEALRLAVSTEQGTVKPSAMLIIVSRTASI